jgi:hypothetical protein
MCYPVIAGAGDVLGYLNIKNYLWSERKHEFVAPRF